MKEMASEKKAVEQSEHDDWNEMSSWGKMRYMFSNITVEPMIFLHVFPAVFASLATQNLNLEKACRVNLNYTDQVCSALTARQTANYTREETEVQQLIASMTIWGTLLKSSFPAMLILFIGSWSDRHKKRKPFMLIPISGEFISALGLLLCVYFFYELPLQVAIFVESFFPAVTGGWMTFFMAVYSFMGDKTTVEMRTVRIGFMSVFKSMSLPLAMALSGVALRVIGFYGIYIVSASMNTISFLYGYFRIKDGSIHNLNVEEKIYAVECTKGSEKTVVNQVSVKPKANFVHHLKDFFDLSHAKETFSVVFRSKENKRKLRIILLIICHVTVYGAWYGEMTIMYLFLRYRFNYDEIKFSILATFNAGILIIGNTISVIVFSHILKFDDATIGVISVISKILADCVLACAQSEWQVYLASVVGMGNAAFIAIRSICSKLVPNEELGKLNSVYETFAALTPFLYGPMYAFIYKWTLTSFPGAVLLVGASLLLPAVVIFWWMHCQKFEEDCTVAGKPSSAEDKEDGTPREKTHDKSEIGHNNPAFQEEKPT